MLQVYLHSNRRGIKKKEEKVSRASFGQCPARHPPNWAECSWAWPEICISVKPSRALGHPQQPPSPRSSSPPSSLQLPRPHHSDTAAPTSPRPGGSLGRFSDIRLPRASAASSPSTSPSTGSPRALPYVQRHLSPVVDAGRPRHHRSAAPTSPQRRPDLASSPASATSARCCFPIPSSSPTARR